MVLSRKILFIVEVEVKVAIGSSLIMVFLLSSQTLKNVI